MPGFDGTGPRGSGPMTGRGMGYCVVPVGDLASARGAGAPAASSYNPAGAFPPGKARFWRWVNVLGHFGRCLGRGFGRRGGRRRW
jgi:hypothetical protein